MKEETIYLGMNKVSLLIGQDHLGFPYCKSYFRARLLVAVWEWAIPKGSGLVCCHWFKGEHQ